MLYIVEIQIIESASDIIDPVSTLVLLCPTLTNFPGSRDDVTDNVIDFHVGTDASAVCFMRPQFQPLSPLPDLEICQLKCMQIVRFMSE